MPCVSFTTQIHEAPPCIDSKELLQDKLDLMQSLMDLAVASSVMQRTRGAAGAMEDANYAALKCQLTTLDRSCDEFTMVGAWYTSLHHLHSRMDLMVIDVCAQVETYMRNTHAATHDTYTLELLHAFSVDRHNEASAFKPWKQLHNRQLLWHGSRLTNWVGILSQGLRIAPPEAPVTGYVASRNTLPGCYS